MKRVVGCPSGLRLVNAVHRRLTMAQRRRFFHLFVAEDWPVNGPWYVDFAARWIVLPLAPDFRYAWLAATAFHGYDPELHELYASLVRTVRPRIFFDVGANYELHSLRMLCHGVRVVSFEPNPACEAFFRACCAANGVTPLLEAVAVTDSCGTAELAVPSGRTWLATTVPHVAAAWPRVDIETLTVPATTLDAYVAERGIVPDLVKIDVEGAELRVLRGGRELFAAMQPLLIFESWSSDRDRDELFGFLEDVDYLVAPVPSTADRSTLSRRAFRTSPATNFVACAPTRTFGVAEPRATAAAG